MLVFVTSTAHAQGAVDLGARVGVALPVGSFDRGTHAGDTSFGGVPLGVDVTTRLGPPARWAVGIGVFAAVAPTIPRLCATASDCVGSLGRDLELGWMTRLRGPKTLFFRSEGELGFGWSWWSRSLEDTGVRSTRRYSGPLLFRAAFVPTFGLGARTRLGVVFGGSVAGTASSHLTAPGVDQAGMRGGVHGTIELGVRLGLDLLDGSAGSHGTRRATPL
jgi:hypothetical protein